MADDAPQQVNTYWTGAAGDGDWSNPDNWSEGVPPPGATYTDGSQDQATIDQSYTGGPVSVTISGAQGAGYLTVNSADPGGPAVSLTGSLDMRIGVTDSGSGVGVLLLNQGTFEIDGGTLEGADLFTDGGGTLAFGDAADHGAATVELVFFNDDLEIGNGSHVVDAIYDVFDNAGHDAVVTVDGGSELEAQGGIYLAGEIDVQDTSSLVLDGGGLTGWSDQTAVVREQGGSFLVEADTTFTNALIDGDWAINQGETVTIAANSTTTFQKNDGADAVVVSIDNDSTLAIAGQLQLTGFLDMGAGTVLLKEGGQIDGGIITGGAVEVDGNATLNAVNVQSPITLLGSDGAADRTGKITLYGSNVFGSDDEATTVDLGGGVLYVVGSLRLGADTTVTNGTIVVEQGAMFDPGSATVDVSAVLFPTQTTWTGAAGTGVWSNAGNWSNGVPVSGEHYQQAGDDVATIDNSVATAPYTATIDGTQRVAELVVNATDPVGGPAVSLTGDLDVEYNEANGGGNFGQVELQQGTFEIDGGHISIADIQQDGGTLAFGNAATFGASTIDASFVHGGFTIGNGSQVVVAPYSFAGFQGRDADGNEAITVTIDGGSTLSIQGSLDVDGTVDVVDGTVSFDGSYFPGEFDGSNNPAVLKLEDGGRLQVTSDFILRNAVTIDGDWSDASGKRLTVVGGATATFQKENGDTPVTVGFDGGSTLEVDGALTVYGALALGDATVELDGGTLSRATVTGGQVVVNGSGDLADAEIDTGLTLSGGAAAAAAFASSSTSSGGAILTIDGDTRLGNVDDNTIDVDLNGGELDVKGTLTLANVNVHNGTIVVEDGGSLVEGDNVTLDSVTVSHNGFQNVALAGQDVDLTSYVTLGGGTSLTVTTGVNADGTTPSGTAGTFTIDYGAGVSGVGLAQVTDANGGPSTTVISGSVTADGGTLHLQTANWSGGGALTAKNGGTLEVGDLTAATQTALTNGLLFQFGTYEADANATLQLDGAQAISDFGGIVTLDGTGSELVTATPDGSITTLEQSLTQIGGVRPDNPYSDFYGTLRLYDGRGFSAQNAIELYGFIGLQGGTLSAPSIDGNEVFFGSGIGTVLSSFIQGFGTVDATLTGNLAIEATDYGTLKIDGDVSNLYASYTVDPNATLEVTHDLVNYATFFLKGGATATLDGRFDYGGILFQGTGATLSIADAAAGTVGVYAVADGDVIHLLGDGDAVAGVAVSRTGTGAALIDVTLASGAHEDFNVQADLSHVAITTASDGTGGETIAFSTPSTSDLQVNAPAPIDLGDVRQGGATTTPISITNGSSTETLSVSIASSSPYNGVVASGSGALAAGTTHDFDLNAGLDTTYAGPKDGAAIIQATETDGSGATTYLAPQTIEVKGRVFRPAAASITATTQIVHVGDPGTGSVTVSNTAYPYDGYSEGLIAAAQSGSGVTPTGTTGVIAPGATDSASLDFTYDTSTAGVFNDSITVGLSTDGDGVDSLGTASEGSVFVPVTVTVDAYAQAALTALGGTLSVDPTNPNAYVLDLGSTTQGGASLGVTLGVTNAATGAADLLSGVFGAASGDTSEFSNGGYGSVSGIAAQGTAYGPNFTLSSSDVGSFSETLTFTPTGYNASGYSGALTPITVTVHGTVLPKPPPPPAPGPVGVAWGDVHYVTFDGLHYDFQAEGEFTLAASTIPGDSFDVQVRNAPYYQGATVTTTQEVAANLGSGHKVSFDPTRSHTVWIDGAAVNAAALTTSNPLTVGDAQIVELSPSQYQVKWSTGEILTVVANGTYLNATVQLPDGSQPGSVKGILGSYSGAANDFQLADGTVIAQPISGADLYGAFADAWRVTQPTSLLDYAPGQTTATFTDKSFPSDQVSLADLPSALVLAAQERVRQAGITDPNIAAAAALDFLVSGNPNAISGSQNVQSSVGSTTQANVAAIVTTSPSAGITAQALSLVEAASGPTTVTFGVYLTAANATDTVLHWTVTAPQSGDVPLSALGSSPTSGDVTVLAGQTSATFSVALPEGALGSAPQEALVVQITPPPGTPIFAPVAQTTVVNAQPTAGPAPSPLVGLLSGDGVLSGGGSSYVVNLGQVVQGQALPALHFAILNAAASGADSLGGSVSGSGLTLSGDGAFTPVAAGSSYDGLFATLATGALGAQSGTITLSPEELNATGYDAALGPISIVVNETVVAAATGAVNPGTAHPNTIDLGAIRSGAVSSGTPTQAITVANTAAAGAAGLDVAVSNLSGGAVASGNVSQLAPGASSSAINVGLDTTTGGAKTGEVDLAFASDTGSHTAPLSTQAVTVTGTVYLEGRAVIAPANAVVHIGDSATQALTVTNATPANGYSEGVEVSAVSASGFAGFSGTTGDVAGGATDDHSLTLQLPVDSQGNLIAGVYSGQVVTDAQTDGTGIDGFGSTDLGQSTQTVTITVANRAAAAIVAGSGGTLSVDPTDPTHYVLDLGDLGVSAGYTQASFGIQNAAPTGAPSDALTGNVGVTSDPGGLFVNGGFQGFNLAAGATDTLPQVAFAPTSAGAFSETIQVNVSSTNADGTVGLTPRTITVKANVLPVQIVAAPVTVNVGGDGHVGLSVTDLSGSDSLVATVVNVSPSVQSASGSTGPLTPGVTDASDLSAVFSTATSGVFTGTVGVDIFDATTNTDLGIVQATAAITVAAPAQAQLVKVSGAGALTAGSTPGDYTLNLGTGSQYGSNLIASLGIANVAAAPSDTISATIDAPTGDSAYLTSTPGAVSGVGAGQTGFAGLFDLTTQLTGGYSETFTIHPLDHHADGSTSALPDIHVTVFGTINPPPPPPPPNAATATAWGDVHLTTFDGLTFNFQAAGEFTLAQSTRAGDSFEVQARMAPYGTGSSVSVMTQVAAKVGDHRVTFGVGRADPLLIDGVASTLTGDQPSIDLGDGVLTQLSGSTYKIVWTNGEVLNVSDAGSYLNINVALSPTDGPGSTKGLLGSDNGVETDFADADGAPINATNNTAITSAQLYGTFADAWRVTDATSLLDYAPGTATADYTFANFPYSPASVADLPADVVARAQAFVAAQGITDPVLVQAAVLDYLVTGDPGAVTASQNVQQSGVNPVAAAVSPPAAPTLPSVGVSANVASVKQAANGSTSVTFTVYLTAAAVGDTTVDYGLFSPDGSYLSASAFGGNPPTGAVTIAAGQTSATFTVDVGASALGSAATAALGVRITLPSTETDPIFAPTAQTQLINGNPAAGAVAAAPLLVVLGTAGAPTVNGNASTLDLGRFIQGEAYSVQAGVVNAASPGADDLTGTVTDTGSATVLGDGGLPTLAAGESYQGLHVALGTGAVGAQSETLTLAGVDTNATGYRGDLAPRTLTLTDTVVAPAVAVIAEAAGVNVGDVRIDHGVVTGGTPTTTLTLSNGAAASDASLDATVSGGGAVVGSGSVKLLAGGASDATDLVVGIDTGADGVRMGQVSLALQSDVGGGRTLALPGQAVTVSGTVYNAASGSLTGPANVIVHVGDTPSVALDAANVAPADGYSEGLRATVTGFSGAVTSASGTTGLIAAGSDDASSLAFGFSTATAGVFTGAVTTALTSDGSAVDGLTPEDLGSTTTNVSFTVDNHAAAAFAELSGPSGIVQIGANAYTLDLGQVLQGGGPLTLSLAALNAAMGQSDVLAGTLSASGDSAFSAAGLSGFSGLAAGQSDTAPMVTLSTDIVGQFTETLTLNGVGSNASGFSETLAPVTLTIKANVVNPNGDLAPVLGAPSSLLVQQGATTTVPGLTIGDGDADAHGQTLTVTISAAGGLISATGPDATGAGTHTVTLTGDLNAVNAELGTLTYTGAAYGHDPITITADDGEGGTDTATIALDVNAPPAIGAPPGVVGHAGETVAVPGVIVSDPDAASASETLTVSVFDSAGVLSVSGGGDAATIAGAGTTAVTITGTLAQVNAALTTLTATDPATGYDPISVRVDDGRGAQTSAQIDFAADNHAVAAVAPGANTTLTQTGAGAYTLDLGIIQQGGAAAVDAFSIRNGAGLPADLLGGTFSVQGDAAFTNGGLDPVSGLSAGQSDTAPTITFSSATAGQFSERITFTPTGSNASGFSETQSPVTITVVGAVNVPPVTTTPSALVTHTGIASAIGGVSVSDGDAVTAHETLTVTLSDTTGQISATGAGVLSGSGTTSLVLQGTLEQVNVSLGTLSYLNGTAGADPITVSTDDGRGGHDTHTIAVTDTDPAHVVINATGGDGVFTQSGTAYTLDLGVISDTSVSPVFTNFTAGNLASAAADPLSGGFTVSGNGSGAFTNTFGSVSNVAAGTSATLGSLQLSTATDGTFSETLTFVPTGPAASSVTPVTVTVKGQVAHFSAPVITAPATVSGVANLVSAIPNVSIADPDAGSGLVTVVVSDAAGALNATVSGAGRVNGAGSNSLTLTGSLSDVNAELKSLTYLTGTAGRTETLRVAVEDIHHSGAAANVTLKSQAAPDVAPILHTPDSFGGGYQPPGSAGVPLTGLSIADPAGQSADPTQIYTFEIKSSNGSTFSVNPGTPTTGVTISGEGTGDISVSGTLSAVNAFLNGGDDALPDDDPSQYDDDGPDGPDSPITGPDSNDPTSPPDSPGPSDPTDPVPPSQSGPTGGDGGTKGNHDNDPIPGLGKINQAKFWPGVSGLLQKFADDFYHGKFAEPDEDEEEVIKHTGPLQPILRLVYPAYGIFKALKNFNDGAKKLADADGDVHLHTFSGGYYDFQGAGEYVLTKSTVAGDTFQIQARMTPYTKSASVSVMRQIAIMLGTDRITFDPTLAGVVRVNGVDLSGAVVNTFAGGTITRVTPQIYKVEWNTGEELTVTDAGTYLNAAIAVPTTDFGNLAGLLGTGGATSDFVTAGGTVLEGPLTKAQLYHTFGDSWRVTDQSSLFDYAAGQSTATFTDINFPGVPVSLANLPADVVAQAAQIVAAAGITDPTVAAAAELDYLATGDKSFVGSAANTNIVLAVNENPTDAGASTGLAVGVVADTLQTVETLGAATTVTFDVYQTGVSTSDTTIAWSVASSTTGGLTAADFPGGVLPSGTATIAAGQTTGQFTVTLPSEILGSAPDKALQIELGSVSNPDGAAIFGPTASSDVVNHTAEPGTAPTIQLAILQGGALTTTDGINYTVDLGDVLQGEGLSSVQLVIGNGAAAGSDLLGGVIDGAASEGFTVDGAGAIQGGIAPGQSLQTIIVTPAPDVTGEQTQVVTFTPTDENVSGYSVALPTRTVTIKENVLQGAVAHLVSSDTDYFADARVGDTETMDVTIANEADAGGAGLDVVARSQGAATFTGGITRLAAGSSSTGDLKVGLDTSQAGGQAGSVGLTFSSDTGTGHFVTLGAGFVDTYGSVYRPASASFGQASTVVHVGDPGSQALTVSNTDPADGYSEGLRVSVTGVSGGFTSGSGATGIVAAGASDASSLVFGYSTATSGVITGAVNLDLVTDGTGVDSITPLDLGPAQLPVSVTVDNYAQIALAETLGAAAFSGSAAGGYTLDLGTVAFGSTPVTIDLSASNAATGLADLLGGAFTVSGSGASAFVNGGLDDFSGLGAGQADSAPTISLKTDAAGTFTETVTLNATGSNASGYAGALAPVTLTVTGRVAPPGGKTFTLTTKPDTFTGTTADDTFLAANATLSAGDKIVGGGGSDTLRLTGAGSYNLSLPTTLSGISTVVAQEGQINYRSKDGSVVRPSTLQIVTLRAGTDVTVNVQPIAAADPQNPNAPSVVIFGADDASVINLGPGADQVHVGGARETVNGGTGNQIFYASGAALNATIHGGAGVNSLMIAGGGVQTMGAGITGISKVSLTAAATGQTQGAYVFTANADAGLAIADGTGQADSITLGDASQSVAVSGAGNATVHATAATAGAAIVGGTGHNTLEIAGGGTAALNASTRNLTVVLDAATTLALNGRGVSVTGSTGDDTFQAVQGTFAKTTSIVGGGGMDTLALTGVGTIDLTAAAAVSGIAVVTAREGQSGYTSKDGTVKAASTLQIVKLRADMDGVVNVLAPAALDPTNPNAAAIVIYGADNAATLNLGAGADQVHVGGARETINGGSGADVIYASGAALNAAIHGGDGADQIIVSGGGVQAMGAAIDGVEKLTLTAAAKGSTQAAYAFMANGEHGLQIVDSSGTADTITVGDASQSVSIYGGADATILATTATAGAIVLGGGGHVTLEIAGGGVVVENAADSKMTAKLDDATDLTLGRNTGLAAIGSGGDDTIRAGARMQTITGGAGHDTLVGFTGGADVFSDTLAGLDGDSIRNFGATGDRIDATDLAYVSGAKPTFVDDASGTFGTLTLGSGPGAASVVLFGQFSAAGFGEASDGHGGATITYTPPAHSSAMAIVAPTS